MVPRKDESLAKGIGGANLVYTQHINRRYNRSGRLWQNRFFSTIVEEGPYLWAVARYIERNPVRVNIVERAEDYPWSSAKAHVLRIRDAILSSEDWLEESEFNAYREFLTDEDRNKEDSIRKATSTGRPLGSDEFIEDLGKILEINIFSKKPGRPKKEK